MLCPKCKKEIVLVGNRYVCTDCGIEIPDNEVVPVNEGSDVDEDIQQKNYMSESSQLEASISSISQTYDKDRVISSSLPVNTGGLSKNSSGSPKSMDGISRDKNTFPGGQKTASNSSNFEVNTAQNYTPLSNNNTQNLALIRNDNSLAQNDIPLPPKDPFEQIDGMPDNNSDIYRNPIFDEKLPSIKEQNKNDIKSSKTINEYFVIVIFGIILVIGLLGGGGYFYYKLSKNQVVANNSSTTTTAPVWNEYKDPANKFVVSLPGETEVTQNDITLSGSTIGATYVSSATADAYYILQYSTLPDNFNISSLDEFYDGILLGMLGDSTGEIISNEKIQFLGNEGSEYLVKINETYSKGKMVLVGKDLYVLVVSTSTDSPSEYSKFIGSFKLGS